MKKAQLSESADKAVSLKMRAIDIVVERMIEPLEDVGNPEKLIGKNFEEWTPEDIGRLTMIYGTREPNPLSNLIFRKKLTEVRELEQEEIM